MTTRRRGTIPVLFLLLLASVVGGSAVQAQSFAVGARGGTMGLGAEASVGITERLAVRAGIGAVPFTPTGTISDIRYEIEPPTPLASAGVDLYLLSNLRLFGGVLFGAERTEFTGKLAESVTIGNQSYPPDQVGSLHGALLTRSAAPYAGLGFGSYQGSGVGVTLDLGVAFLGENDLELSADGPIAGEAAFRQELERERLDVQDDLRRYSRFLPVLNLGIHVAMGR